MSSRAKKLSFCLYALLLAGIIAALILSSTTPPASIRRQRTILLTRDALTVFDFPAKTPEPSATIIFGSGDGGWGGFEESIARALQEHGYDVIGVDSARYAATDYDLQTLQSDFVKIARDSPGTFPRHCPLIVGGYSMGAGQAIAVAGGPHPPPGLVGLLLVDPCSRGRYGLRTADQMNMLPTGSGTFSMVDFSKTMANLRVVQWHATQDSIDSRAWLDSLSAQHREFDFPNDGHGYESNRDEFLLRLVSSVAWIINPGPDGRIAGQNKEGP
jgi:hypothetical protein